MPKLKWTLHAGLITPQDFVRITSTACAQIFNIYPRKGVIAVGSDADIIVLDPEVEHVISARTHHSAVDTNVYEGRKVRGKVSFKFSGSGREAHMHSPAHTWMMINIWVFHDSVQQRYYPWQWAI